MISASHNKFRAADVIRAAGPQVAEQRGEAVIADERGVTGVAPICKT